MADHDPLISPDGPEPESPYEVLARGIDAEDAALDARAADERERLAAEATAPSADPWTGLASAVDAQHRQTVVEGLDERRLAQETFQDPDDVRSADVQADIDRRRETLEADQRMLDRRSELEHLEARRVDVLIEAERLGWPRVRQTQGGSGAWSGEEGWREAVRFGETADIEAMATALTAVAR